MKLYKINIPIEGYVSYEVEADSIEEAKELVLNGQADYDGDISYDENFDSNTWLVEEIEDLEEKE